MQDNIPSGGLVPHASTHVNGGSDEINQSLNLSAIPNHASSHVDGGSDEINQALDDLSLPFKLEPSASDELRESSDGVVSTSATVYVKVKSITIPSFYDSGSFRVKFDLRTGVTDYVAYARIYKNGSAYGTQRTNPSTSYQTFSEDLSFTGGDTIELWIHGVHWSANAYARNFRVYASDVIIW